MHNIRNPKQRKTQWDNLIISPLKIISIGCFFTRIFRCGSILLTDLFPYQRFRQLCICLAFPSHVTSSANGQLYTIKTNKDLLMRLLKRGAFLFQILSHMLSRDGHTYIMILNPQYPLNIKVHTIFTNRFSNTNTHTHNHTDTHTHSSTVDPLRHVTVHTPLCMHSLFLCLTVPHSHICFLLNSYFPRPQNKYCGSNTIVENTEY